MIKIRSLSLLISLFIISCTERNNLGLDVHPPSNIITFNDTASFSWQTSQTIQGDSIRTDESLNLILGEIKTDPVFGYSQSAFYTQILLAENNVNLGLNPQVDSVIFSYTYSDYYGNLSNFTSLEVNKLTDEIFKDSIYYSSSFSFPQTTSSNLVQEYEINQSSNTLNMKLSTDIGYEILNLGNQGIVDNEIFLQYFKGLRVLAQSENTMLYLNPEGLNSYFRIYYHNDDLDSLSLDFDLGDEAARINLFNPKLLSDIVQNSSERYIQSMGGSKLKITFENLNNIRSLLSNKVLNKVSLSFEAANYDNVYVPHDKLRLVKIENDNTLLLPDAYEGASHIGGNFVNGKYEFNITLYFNDILQGTSDISQLYLFSATPAENANRTILSENIVLDIHFSELN